MILKTLKASTVVQCSITAKQGLQVSTELLVTFEKQFQTYMFYYKQFYSVMNKCSAKLLNLYYQHRSFFLFLCIQFLFKCILQQCVACTGIYAFQLVQRGKINVYCFVCDLILSDFSLLFILNLKGPFWYFRISLEVKEYTFLLFRHLVKLLNTLV